MSRRQPRQTKTIPADRPSSILTFASRPSASAAPPRVRRESSIALASSPPPRLHFDDAKSRSDVDVWRETARLCIPVKKVASHPWEDSQTVEADHLNFTDEREPAAEFADLPSEMSQPKPYAGWQKSLKDHLYREARLALFFCSALKQYSQPDESEGDFKGRLKHALHEERDLQIEKVRKKYASKIERLQDRYRRARAKVEKEKSQASSATMSAALSFGQTVLSALFGRKLASATNVSKAATSMRSAGRAVDQRGDIKRAEANAEAIAEDIKELEGELESELDRIRDETSVDSLESNRTKSRRASPTSPSATSPSPGSPIASTRTTPSFLRGMRRGRPGLRQHDAAVPSANLVQPQGTTNALGLCRVGSVRVTPLRSATGLRTDSACCRGSSGRCRVRRPSSACRPRTCRAFAESPRPRSPAASLDAGSS